MDKFGFSSQSGSVSREAVVENDAVDDTELDQLGESFQE